ncbi:MAG: DNA polymerase I [Phycisphaeraceae bacterium]|nr:DNA polymerase I [Phycisphaeraceae bacterium]
MTQDAPPTRTPAPESVLYLIDGHAQIFRAYFAIRGGMSSPVTGEPTAAVFAFAGMLLKLFEQYRARHVVMAIDLPGKTFRDELYPEYKANRDPPPDDFHPQEQRIFEMTRSFGIPIVGVPGAEADDVIATIVQRIIDDPDRSDLSIRIVSRDKDLEQLLDDRVAMFDIHKDQLIDVASLMADKGIRPDQVADVLALAGDNVDNIAGVEGIGPKTAAKLVSEYESIDGVLANLDRIKGKRHERITAARDRLPLNLELVRLKRDVAFEFDLVDAECRIDAAALRKMFQDLGFRRHIQDLDRLVGGAAPAPAESDGFEMSLFGELDGSDASVEAQADVVPEGFTTAEDRDYRAITTQVELDELVAALRAAPLVSVDTETIRLGRRARVCGLSFSYEPDRAVYVPMISPQPEDHLDKQTVLAALRDVLEDPSVPKCGHNLKYDAIVLRYSCDVRLRGVAFDSMIASQLLGLPAHGLDQLAATLLQHSVIPIGRLIGAQDSAQKTMDEVPLEAIVPYAAEDADVALRLADALAPKLREAGMQDLADVEMPLVEVLADLECNGIRVDPDELVRQKEALTGRIVELRDQIHELCGEPINLDSPKQLGEILFNKLGLPVIKRGKTGPSTDVEVLERLAARADLPPEQTAITGLIVEYRQFSKLVNTYLDNLRHSIEKSDGRIHASFQQLGAATGRLSSGGPNLQNIPVRTDVGRQIRKAFIAAPDHVLICADYSQIELRLLAHLSQDPALLDAFNRDLDIHAAVAAEVFDVAQEEVSDEQRARAKVVNFGIIYGITAWGLSRRISGLDPASAARLIEDYRTRFAGIDQFMHRCVEEALEKGYVTTLLGRRRRITQIQSRNTATRALAERLAINTVVQGSATGDLIKKAMVNLYRRIQRDALPMRMLVQIHDELIFESPAEIAEAHAEIVREEMAGAMDLTVPLKVDVGIATDWQAAK